jgi:uncharacterized membrane protein
LRRLERSLPTDLGRHLFGVAAIALGILGFYYRDFATVWQPVPAQMPMRSLAAILTAGLFLGAGSALQFRPGIRFGAIVLTILYSVFALLWARRIIGYPTIFATWGGTAEQLAPTLAALTLALRESSIGDEHKNTLMRCCTIGFGFCAVAFGFNHFFNMTITAGMVPVWLPFRGWWWALGTGVAHITAGLAMISNIFPRTAAILLTLMFVLFGLLVWAPLMVSASGIPITWTGNAVNLSLIGAAWIMADLLRRRGDLDRVRSATV